MNIKIAKTSGDRINVYTPYNSDFVARVKNAGGRWDSETKCWSIPAEALEVVRAIMRDVYGIDDSNESRTVKVRLTFASEVYEYCNPVTILGHTVSRAYGRDSGAKPGTGVYFEVGAPKSGGSVKNWTSVVEQGSIVVLSAVPTTLLDRATLPEGVTSEIISPPAIDRVALSAERERLAQRIKEIDLIMSQNTEEVSR